MGDDRSLAGVMKYWSLPRNLLLSLLCLVAAGCTDTQQDFWVDDRAALLQEDQVERLNRYHKVLFEQLDVHFKVVILEEASADIDKTAIEEFGTLGEKTSAARGLLFLVDPKSQQARIEVGYDLEHIFPDGFVGNVEELQMKPFFAKGLVGPGIEAVGELLVQRLLQGEQAKQRQKLPAQQYYSGGGGAKVETKAAPANYEKQAVSDPSVYSGAATPEEALELYQQVLAQHIKDPNLPFIPSQRENFHSMGCNRCPAE